MTVRFIADPFGQVVVLQVEDSGPGIAVAGREKVFRPFYRALGTGADGSGLGLVIVREIAARHGAAVVLADANERPRDPVAGAAGAVTRAAAAGVGACFTLRLAAVPRPLARPDERLSRESSGPKTRAETPAVAISAPG